LIFLFGQKKPAVPRAVINAPTMRLAGEPGELLALNDPTLFALPRPGDFTPAIWLAIPDVITPSFRWTEPPRWLPLAADGLGAALGQFLQTNFTTVQTLNFKSAPVLFNPPSPVESMIANQSTLRIDGELAQRQLPSQIILTNWPYPNLIASSVVQALVAPAGNVISAILLPPGDGYALADQYDAADQRALDIARAMRFKPSSQLTFGRIIFNWHTVPPTNETNR
jgi:hypothetical protein